MTNNSAEDRIWTPANVVTMMRILLIPVFMVVALIDPSTYGDAGALGRSLASGLVFLALSLTDGIDGYLARSRNEVSTFGKLIDPIADKVLVMAAFLVLVQQGATPAWMALVVVTREFLVSGLRMLAASRSLIIAASWSGKAKTMTTIIALALCLLTPALSQAFPALSSQLPSISHIIMWIAILLTIFSGVEYFAKCWSVFSPPQRNTLQPEDAHLDEEIAQDDAGSISSLSEEIVTLAQEAGLHVATAESCTGGMVAAALTQVPGASAVVRGGIVSYSNEVKHALLSVDNQILDDKQQGAVSAACAHQMACGALCKLNAEVAVSVTGMAGPTSNEPAHPVGQVFVGLAYQRHNETVTEVTAFQFSGDRTKVRTEATCAALRILRDHLR